eukprot:scaffold7341_cov129-Isochrysis_galbana.AAC.2
MEQLPADARAAPSASAPNDIVMDIASSPKRPRDPAQDNKVSQRATLFDPAMLEIQVRTTECLLREPARACQSLAHHTTLTGRCPKSVDTWDPLCEDPPQPCIPEMKGRAPGGKVKGGGDKGGNASLPGDSRVSRRADACALAARRHIRRLREGRMTFIMVSIEAAPRRRQAAADRYRRPYEKENV